MNNYLPPQASAWTGRQTDPALGPQYWYQRMQLLDVRHLETASPRITHALVGYACDEGVRRNQGRVGAVDGPAVARTYLGKMAAHFGPETVIADAGTVSCPDGDLETCQATYAEIVSRLRRQGIIPIGIGGGHDIAFGTYSGLRAALPSGRIGILNFDAHFDLRAPTDGPNSGTPFHQILARHGKDTAYCVVGIQRLGNTPFLFQTAADLGVTYLERPLCANDPMSRKAVSQRLRSFIDEVDHLYVTVDLDGFSAAYAPGVSASSPVGFSPSFFFPVLEEVLRSSKLVGLDVAEFNPLYDRADNTLRLLGNVIAAVLIVPRQLTQ
ncbi:MAG: formimidoylglutamase [Bacteroidota bacterium]